MPQTPYLNLNLPPTGFPSWGPDLNQNFSALDAAVGALQRSYQGDWVNNRVYAAGQIVIFNNGVFISLSSGNINLQPDLHPEAWGPMGSAASISYPPAGIAVSSGSGWSPSLSLTTAFVPQTLTQNVTVNAGGFTLALTGAQPTLIGGTSSAAAVSIASGGAISTPANISATGTNSIVVVGDQNAQLADSTVLIPQLVLSVAGTAGTKFGGQFRFSTSNPSTDATLQTLTLNHYTAATADTRQVLSATRQGVTVGGIIAAGPSPVPIVVPMNQSILAWNVTGNGDTSFINGRGSGWGGFNWYVVAPNANPGNPLMTLDYTGALTVLHFTLPSATNNLEISQDGGSTFIDGGAGGRLLINTHRDGGILAVHGAFSCDANGAFGGNCQAGTFLCPGSGFMTGGGNNLILNPASGTTGTIMLNWNNSATGGTWFGNGSSVPVASVSGTGVISGSAKNFVIPHPLDPTKHLTHSAIEGPEHGVYYRGEGETSGGIAMITLPDYFEALVRPEGRTIQLTERFDDDPDPMFGNFLAAGRINDGKFTVRSSSPAVKFYWEVKAVRGDLQRLDVEDEDHPWSRNKKLKEPVQ
jgi:Tfp pilus assembly protein FimT